MAIFEHIMCVYAFHELVKSHVRNSWGYCSIKMEFPDDQNRRNETITIPSIQPPFTLRQRIRSVRELAFQKKVEILV